MTVKLEVSKRTNKADKDRKEGNVPGVVYGPKQEPVAISVSKKVFQKTLEEAGESTIITLEGLDEPIEVLVHDVAFNAEFGGISHVDFYAIERGKELTTDIALHFIGEAPAVKLGGSLTKVLHEVEVTCRPSVLPSHFDVDVSALVDFESIIKVKDLNVPTGVKINTDEEEVIALVVETEDEPEPEVVEAGDVPVVGADKKEAEKEG
ncbi:50S ribosomal protein L25 [Candidatus Kaiserbacteria bacterium]|nr:50S ribosomal protein L25 [Candidatus Kaiserbacteria bacterium]